MIVQQVVCYTLEAYTIVLFVRVILSWIPAPPEPVRPIANAVRAVTDPILVPLRGVIPPLQMGGMALDLSILVVFLVLWILRGLLCGSVSGLL